MDKLGAREQERERRVDNCEHQKSEITVLNPNSEFTYKKLMRFSEGEFPEYYKEVFRKFGFDKTTPIQEHSIPIALEYKDVIGIAQTGSGKTLGYVVPAVTFILEEIKTMMEKGEPWDNKGKPMVLVLAPTRELAIQIHQESMRFLGKTSIRIVLVYGGAKSFIQKRELESGVDLLIATPGRLIDFLEKGTINLEKVIFLALDEADRMLDMGFMPQINKINSFIKNEFRQTMLFSATWPSEVDRLSKSLLKDDAIKITVGRTDLTSNKDITQKIIFVEDFKKKRRLFANLVKDSNINPNNKMLVFMKTKKDCDRFEKELNDDGFSCKALHGDKSQDERDTIFADFKSSNLNILIATDVASRGLDIPAIRIVVNYDFPQTIEDYIHRIGRTGRAGAKGTSYTFFENRNSKFARPLVEILEKTGQEIPSKLQEFQSSGSYGEDRPRYHSSVKEAVFDSEAWNREREKPRTEDVKPNTNTSPRDNTGWGGSSNTNKNSGGNPQNWRSDNNNYNDDANGGWGDNNKNDSSDANGGWGDSSTNDNQNSGW